MSHTDKLAREVARRLNDTGMTRQDTVRLEVFKLLQQQAIESNAENLYGLHPEVAERLAWSSLADDSIIIAEYLLNTSLEDAKARHQDRERRIDDAYRERMSLASEDRRRILARIDLGEIGRRAFASLGNIRCDEEDDPA